MKIRVQAYDRAGLLADITQIINEEKINLEDASAVTARQDNLAIITATLEVRDAEQLEPRPLPHRPAAERRVGETPDG